MDLDDLRAAVLVRMGRPAEDAMFPEARLTDMVNAALRAVSTEQDWAWLEDSESLIVTAGVDLLIPDADWERTISLHRTDGWELERKPVQEVARIVASGQPKMYAVTGDKLLVRPTPASGPGALTHRYIRAEPELTDDTDEPLLPARWHDLIVEYAAYLGFRREGDDTSSMTAKAAYDDLLQQMIPHAHRTAQAAPGGGEMPAVAT